VRDSGHSKGEIRVAERLAMTDCRRDTARAMSEENVEIVRSGYAAFNRGDIDAAFKDFAPDFECDMSRAIGFNIDRDIYDLAQFRRMFDDYVASWEDFQLVRACLYQERAEALEAAGLAE
jgi:hypothetical protein